MRKLTNASIASNLARLNNSGVDYLESGRLVVASEIFTHALVQIQKICRFEKDEASRSAAGREDDDQSFINDKMTLNFQPVVCKHAPGQNDESPSNNVTSPSHNNYRSLEWDRKKSRQHNFQISTDEFIDDDLSRLYVNGWKIHHNDSKNDRSEEETLSSNWISLHSMTILFNLALTYHLLALEERLTPCQKCLKGATNNPNKKCCGHSRLQASANLYEFANKTSLDVNVQVSIVMKLIILNNLGHLYKQLEYDSKAQQYLERLLSALTLMKEIEKDTIIATVTATGRSSSSSSKTVVNVTEDTLKRFYSNAASVLFLKDSFTASSA